MTPEEAVEEVLGKRVFETCSGCGGRGQLLTPSPQYGKRHGGIRDRRGFQRSGPPGHEKCLTCRGRGLVVRDRYRNACLQMGITEVDDAPPLQPIPITGLERYEFCDIEQEWVDLS